MQFYDDRAEQLLIFRERQRLMRPHDDQQIIAARQGVLFDLSKFSWIGKAADDTRALMISKSSNLKNIDDIIKSKTPIKFAAAGVGSAAYNDTKITRIKASDR